MLEHTDARIEVVYAVGTYAFDPWRSAIGVGVSPTTWCRSSRSAVLEAPVQGVEAPLT